MICARCHNFVSAGARCGICGWRPPEPVVGPSRPLTAPELAAWCREHLTREQRIILELAYADGLEADEIGQVLGLSEQFVGEELRVTRQQIEEAAR